MDKDQFFIIVEQIYNNSREFWDVKVPEKLSSSFKFGGLDSSLSSLELVTFFAELETELINFNINISFLDKLLEREIEELTFSTLYELIN